MKNLCFLFLVFTVLACSEENPNVQDFTIIQEFEFSAKNFVNSTVAYEKNDVIKLGVSDQKLLNSFNKYSKEYELGTNADAYSIEKIKDAYYIRFYNDNINSVSTIALIANEKKVIDDELIITYKSGNTVCTTEACSSCCGCIPNGSYCTNCTRDYDDCKRTTSSFQYGD